MLKRVLIGGSLFGIALVVAVGVRQYLSQPAYDNFMQVSEERAPNNADWTEDMLASGAAEVKDFDLAQATYGSDANVHPALKINENDRVLGDPNAPVTIIEYSSMTCPHCAYFHNEVLPELEKAYIDTGKVKFVMRDLPWDPAAATVSMISRCAPEEQYYPLIKAFFRTQETWLRSADPMQDILKTARLAGMDQDTVSVCANDEALKNEVNNSRKVALEVLQVKGTPTLFINGERFTGRPTIREVNEAVEAAVNAATKAQS